MTESQRKLEAMKAGQTVVTNDKEMDEMIESGDESAFKIRSLPNPNQVGILDQYVAWIGPVRTYNL